MNSFFARAVTAGASLAVAGTVWAAPIATAAPADPYALGMTEAERDYCAYYVQDCTVAYDAKQWALSTSEWRYGTDREVQYLGIGDAYRHCILAGALTQRLGTERARTLLNVHEMVPDDTDLEDSIMDYMNNSKGIEIGAQANKKGGSDTWGWIMKQCGALADAGKLKTLR